MRIFTRILTFEKKKKKTFETSKVWEQFMGFPKAIGGFCEMSFSKIA